MAHHNILGRSGEDAAVQFLIDNGYIIRHRNWRRKHLELDIVATLRDVLVVVEVKTRTDSEFAMPEDAVTARKIKRIVTAADTYIRLFEIDLPVRFDVITVLGNEENFTIEHIKEAYYSPLF